MTTNNVQSLDDLKAELAKEDAAAAETAKVAAAKAALDEETPPENAETTPAQGDKPEEKQASDSTISDDTGKKEPWMETDEPSLKGSDGKVVPVGAIQKTRQKFQIRIEERDDEIAKLKKQLEEVTRLVKPQTLAEMPRQPMKRPDPLDYPNDPAQFQAADQRWLTEQANRVFDERFQNLGKQAQQEERKRQLEKSLDNHYQEVNELLEQNKLNADDYRENERKFRDVVSLYVKKEAANSIGDQLIAELGTGSSKVIWYLGKNPSALDKFSTLLAQDPSGFRAFAYLAEVKAERAIQPRIAHSKAPVPASRASGNAGGNAEGELKRRLQKATKENDGAEIFQARRAAKAAGLNPDKF